MDVVKMLYQFPHECGFFHDFLRMYLGFGRSLGNLEVLDCCIYLQFEDSNFKAILLAVVLKLSTQTLSSWNLMLYLTIGVISYRRGSI